MATKIRFWSRASLAHCMVLKPTFHDRVSGLSGPMMIPQMVGADLTGSGDWLRKRLGHKNGTNTPSFAQTSHNQAHNTIGTHFMIFVGRLWPSAVPNKCIRRGARRKSNRQHTTFPADVPNRQCPPFGLNGRWCE